MDSEKDRLLAQLEKFEKTVPKPDANEVEHDLYDQRIQQFIELLEEAAGELPEQLKRKFEYAIAGAYHPDAHTELDSLEEGTSFPGWLQTEQARIHRVPGLKDFFVLLRDWIETQEFIATKKPSGPTAEKCEQPNENFTKLDRSLSFCHGDQSKRKSEIRFFKEGDWYKIKIRPTTARVIQHLYGLRKKDGNDRAIRQADLAKKINVTAPAISNARKETAQASEIIGKMIIVETSNGMISLNQELECFKGLTVNTVN
jgi:hypothetical protein